METNGKDRCHIYDGFAPARRAALRIFDWMEARFDEIEPPTPGDVECVENIVRDCFAPKETKGKC